MTKSRVPESLLERLKSPEVRRMAPVVALVAMTMIGFGFFLGATGGSDAPVAAVDPTPGDGQQDATGGSPVTTATGSPTAAPPAGDCDPMHEDVNGDWIYFPQRNPERMFSKEGYKFNYHLPWVDHIEEHGIAIERPGTSGDCFQQRFFCSWGGYSAEEGFPEAGFQPDRYADGRLHFGVAGFTMPERERDGYGTTWPHETFTYVAYARTADGTYHVTPLEGASLGDGLVEVRYHNKGNNAGEAIPLCDPIAAGVIDG